MIIQPIPDRTDIAAVAERFKKTGHAIEVGVWRGEFAAHNLQYWSGQYWLCDAWGYRPDGTKDKNMVDAGSWREVMQDAIANVRFAKERVSLKIGYSVEIAAQFPDEFFDWIYIDALHDEVNVRNDLNAWFPKLRKGGLFSGDDYGTCGTMADRWASVFGDVAKAYSWGTMYAVNEFCMHKCLQHHVTWLNDKYKTPAWYLIK